MYVQYPFIYVMLNFRLILFLQVYTNDERENADTCIPIVPVLQVRFICRFNDYEIIVLQLFYSFFPPGKYPLCVLANTDVLMIVIVGVLARTEL